MINAVILDWSGVVSNDLELVYEITGKVFDRLGLEFMSIEEFRDRFDLPYMDFYRSMGITLEKAELDHMFKQLFVENGKKAAPFPFAKRALLWLKKKGIKLAVFSSHPQDFLEKEIIDYGLAGFFSHVMGSAHDKREFINGLVEKIGAIKDETLLVGDMAHDIEAGSLAGIRTAAVLSGYHAREKLLGQEPNFILNDIRDLKFIVGGCYA